MMMMIFLVKRCARQYVYSKTVPILSELGVEDRHIKPY